MLSIFALATEHCFVVVDFFCHISFSAIYLFPLLSRFLSRKNFRYFTFHSLAHTRNELVDVSTDGWWKFHKKKQTNFLTSRKTKNETITEEKKTRARAADKRIIVFEAVS